MMMKEHIQSLIQSGGKISYPFKLEFKDWIEEIKLVQLSMYKFPVVFTVYGIKQFDSINEAVNFFGLHAFHKKNVAVGLKGAIKHNLLSSEEVEDLEYLSIKKIKDAVRQYYNQYYDAEYPFAGEFQGKFQF